MLTVKKAERVLHEHGMRVTPQRRAVVSYLEGNKLHPTADDVVAHIQKQMPTVAVSTVYNILHELEEVGLISQLAVDGVMHFDPQEQGHAHLLCKVCSKIVDIEMPARFGTSLAGAVTKQGATLDNYHVNIVGICPTCKSK